MEDEEDLELENNDLDKVIKLLVQIRTNKVQQLNTIYLDSLASHKQCVEKTIETEKAWTLARQEGIVSKSNLQKDILNSSTDVTAINSWLTKEKEIDKAVQGNKCDVDNAKQNEMYSEENASKCKERYLAAQKRLEKINIFREEYDDR